MRFLTPVPLLILLLLFFSPIVTAYGWWDFFVAASGGVGVATLGGGSFLVLKVGSQSAYHNFFQRKNASSSDDFEDIHLEEAPVTLETKKGTYIYEWPPLTQSTFTTTQTLGQFPMATTSLIRNTVVYTNNDIPVMNLSSEVDVSTDVPPLPYDKCPNIPFPPYFTHNNLCPAVVLSETLAVKQPLSQTNVTLSLLLAAGQRLSNQISELQLNTGAIAETCILWAPVFGFYWVLGAVVFRCLLMLFLELWFILLRRWKHLIEHDKIEEHERQLRAIERRRELADKEERLVAQEAKTAAEKKELDQTNHKDNLEKDTKKPAPGGHDDDSGDNDSNNGDDDDNPKPDGAPLDDPTPDSPKPDGDQDKDTNKPASEGHENHSGNGDNDNGNGSKPSAPIINSISETPSSDQPARQQRARRDAGQRSFYVFGNNAPTFCTDSCDEDGSSDENNDFGDAQQSPHPVTQQPIHVSSKAQASSVTNNAQNEEPKGKAIQRPEQQAESAGVASLGPEQNATSSSGIGGAPVNAVELEIEEFVAPLLEQQAQPLPQSDDDQLLVASLPVEQNEPKEDTTSTLQQKDAVSNPVETEVSPAPLPERESYTPSHFENTQISGVYLEEQVASAAEVQEPSTLAPTDEKSENLEEAQDSETKPEQALQSPIETEETTTLASEPSPAALYPIGNEQHTFSPTEFEQSPILSVTGEEAQNGGPDSQLEHESFDIVENEQETGYLEGTEQNPVLIDDAEEDVTPAIPTEAVPPFTTLTENEEAPVPSEEAPTVGEETLVPVEEAFTVAEEVLIPTEEALVTAEEVLIPTEEVLAAAEEAHISTEEALTIAEEALVPTEETHVTTEEVLVPTEAHVPAEEVLVPAAEAQDIIIPILESQAAVLPVVLERTSIELEQTAEEPTCSTIPERSVIPYTAPEVAPLGPESNEAVVPSIDNQQSHTTPVNSRQHLIPGLGNLTPLRQPDISVASSAQHFIPGLGNLTQYGQTSIVATQNELGSVPPLEPHHLFGAEIQELPANETQQTPTSNLRRCRILVPRIRGGRRARIVSGQRPQRRPATHRSPVVLGSNRLPSAGDGSPSPSTFEEPEWQNVSTDDSRTAVNRKRAQSPRPRSEINKALG